MTKPWLDRIEKRVLKTMETQGNFKPFSFDQVLAGCANAYNAGVKLRHALYGGGILKSKRLDCPVISIGNLAVGGSGKTPMTLWLAKMLVQKGLRPVVISRGYRGTLDKPAAVVCDGPNVFLEAAVCGDEPYMTAMEKAFPVVVGKDRYTAGLLALKTFAPDVIILDDGFQHLKLDRNLNLVLLDYNRPLGNRRTLPAGRLRETLDTAKNRIDALVFTRCPTGSFQKLAGTGPVQQIIQTVPSKPVFFCTHEPFLAQLFPAGSTTSTTDYHPGNLKGKTALLFSGLAQNASFAQSVQALNVNIADHLEFADHHRYSESDFERIAARARALNIDVILTTQKDWVKVPPESFLNLTVAVIGIQIRFFNPDNFEKFIFEKTFEQDAGTGSSNCRNIKT